MEEVLVAVLREDDLTVSGRRVSKMSCGQCMEALVLASNQDRVLSRVVVDLIIPRRKHLVANGEVERDREPRCLGVCANAAHRDQGRRQECEYRNAFHGGSPFRGHLSICLRLASNRSLHRGSKKLAVKPP